MTIKIREIFKYLFLLLPLSLISGPAIPDLTITFGGTYILFFILLRKENYKLINDNFIQISIIFWLSLIFISFFSINKEKSFQDSIIFFRFLMIPICCYYFFFYDGKNLKNLLFIIFILVILVSIDTLYQFFNYTSKDGFGKDLLGFKSEWYGRLTGPFRDELIPGSYISKFTLLGFIYLIIKKPFKYHIILESIYLGTALLVCFVSGERMALASYCLALVILLFFLKNRRYTIIFSLLIGLSLIYLVYKYHPFYNDYKIIDSNEYHQGLEIEKSFVCEDNNNLTCTKIIRVQPSFFKILKNFSTSAYGEIYLLSLNMFKNNPITGVGLNNFKYVCENDSKYKSLMVNYDCASHPHNTYIQWLTEGGLIVFIFFIIYLFIIFKLIIKNDGDKDLKIISLASLLILFWPIMSTGSLIKNWYGIAVFFIIGICLCLSKLKKDSLKQNY